MGKAALIHGIVDQGRLFICAGGMLYEEKESGKGKTFSYTKEVVDVKIVCIIRKGDVFCEPAAAWMSE